MKIIIACDHSGVNFKKKINTFLNSLGIKIIDLGVDQEDQSVDYPDVAQKAVTQFQKQKADKFILICGTGIGISIAANKIKNTLCALVRDSYSAQMAVQHNHVQGIALGARVHYQEPIEDILSAFLNTQPEGGRHQRRVDKMLAIKD